MIQLLFRQQVAWSSYFQESWREESIVNELFLSDDKQNKNRTGLLQNKAWVIGCRREGCGFLRDSNGCFFFLDDIWSGNLRKSHIIINTYVTDIIDVT